MAYRGLETFATAVRSTGAPVAAIIGTRPEAIKMAPVVRALDRLGVPCAVVVTGQHPDLDLPGANFPRKADAMLPLDARDLDADAMCDRIEALACTWIEHARPRLVLVQGDTNSALAGARAAKRCGIAVGHVEAGLRTFDLDDPWPEERNRVVIDRIANLLFAPTSAACRNLVAENVRGAIMLTGNTAIDAVMEGAAALKPMLRDPSPMILVTMHRRENRGAGMLGLAKALGRIACQSEASFSVVLHPNKQARADMVAAMRDVPYLRLLEPQSYSGMIALMLRSHLILTDSGGLQEEAPALGRPLLILRASTERPEVLESGNAILVGTDPGRIVRKTLRLLRDPQAHAAMSMPTFPFGSGGSAALIADAVRDYLARNAAPLRLDPVPLPA